MSSLSERGKVWDGLMDEAKKSRKTRSMRVSSATPVGMGVEM